MIMNKKIGIILGAFILPLVACGGYDAPQSADTSIKPLVINGTPSKLGDRPYQVAMFTTSDTGKKTYFCGGTVISKKWILTAAHCVEDQAVKRLGIHAGSLDRTDGQEIAVKRFIMHSDYDFPKNDIAVLELESDLKFNDSVSAATLPVKAIERANAAPGSMQILSGWGVMMNGEEKKVPSQLLEAPLEVLTQEVCFRSFRSSLNDDMMCGAKTAKGQTGCYGDSGGPFANRVKGQHFVFGIVSSATREDCRGATVFTRVSAFQDWITKKTGVQSAKQDTTQAFMTVEPITSVGKYYFPEKNQYLQHLGGEITIMFNTFDKSKYTVKLQRLNNLEQWENEQVLESKPPHELGNIKGKFPVGNYRLEIETSKQGEGSSYQIIGSYNKNPNSDPVKPIYDSLNSFKLNELLDISKDRTVILNFYVNLPGGKSLHPALKKKAQEDKGSWVLGFVHHTRNQYLAYQYDVNTFPTLIAIKNGKEVARHRGTNGALNWVDEQIK